MDDRPSTCPVCRHKVLSYGSSGLYRLTFIPFSRRFFPKSFAAHSFVCLACGYMGHYLSPRMLRKLRTELAQPASKMTDAAE